MWIFLFIESIDLVLSIILYLTQRNQLSYFVMLLGLKTAFGWIYRGIFSHTAWKVSKCGVFLVRIFLYSDKIRRFTEYFDTFHTVIFAHHSLKTWILSDDEITRDRDKNREGLTVCWPISDRCSHFIPPENTRKPTKSFRMFSKGVKWERWPVMVWCGYCLLRIKKHWKLEKWMRLLWNYYV